MATRKHRMVPYPNAKERGHTKVDLRKTQDSTSDYTGYDTPFSFSIKPTHITTSGLLLQIISETDREVTAYYKTRSDEMERISCDACPSRHSEKRKHCSANIPHEIPFLERVQRTENIPVGYSKIFSLKASRTPFHDGAIFYEAIEESTAARKLTGGTIVLRRLAR